MLQPHPLEGRGSFHNDVRRCAENVKQSRESQCSDVVYYIVNLIELYLHLKWCSIFCLFMHVNGPLNAKVG